MYTDTKPFLADTKFYEAYSRYDDEKGRYETWGESVDRVMEMHKTFYKDKMTPKLTALIEEVTHSYKKKHVLGAQRALQFGGEQLLRNHMKLYNCSATYADRPAFFGEAFFCALSGTGVGFSVQKHHIAKLPKIHHRSKNPKQHVVEDSIEGWATSLDILMSSYFLGGGKHPEFEGRKIYFDLSKIRPKGAFISGGFKAPGPDPLRLALDRIEYILQGLTLKNKSATLSAINVYDIVMHAADAVISGGVRRAATICLFSIDDEEMINAKTGNWFVDNPQRGRSNNSAVVVRDEVTREQFSNVMKSVKSFGEPGFVFVNSREHAFNPCVEISLYPQFDGESGFQGCNLTEINGSVCSTKEIFHEACRISAILGTLQAGYTNFGFLSPTSKKIFDREALLGSSITGWMSNPKILFDPEILREGAEIIKKVNKEVAKMIGINPAARTTCGKPAGTTSVLLMTPSGISGEHSPKYIRNVQLNKETEVAQLIRKTNPAMVEESVWSANKSDYVVSFPCISSEGSIFKDDLLGVKHLEMIKIAQQNWVNPGTNEELCADKNLKHNISNTIIVDDWDAVEEYVFNNRHVFAGISFLGLFGDKDYNQAPFIKVIEADEMVKLYGNSVVFASEIVAEGIKAYGDIWAATSAAQGFGDFTIKDDQLRTDWKRKFKEFSETFFDNDVKKSEYCLKDVALLHRWQKINQSLAPVDWSAELTQKKFTNIDTMAAAACAGGNCEI